MPVPHFLSHLTELLPPPALPFLPLLKVHQGMAEQAFKQQVQSVLGDGNLTPDRAAALEKMRAQMGLGQDAADKIIRGFTNQKAIAGMQVGGGGCWAVCGCWVMGCLFVRCALGIGGCWVVWCVLGCGCWAVVVDCRVARRSSCPTFHNSRLLMRAHHRGTSREICSEYFNPCLPDSSSRTHSLAHSSPSPLTGPQGSGPPVYGKGAGDPGGGRGCGQRAGRRRAGTAVPHRGRQYACGTHKVVPHVFCASLFPRVDA